VSALPQGAGEVLLRPSVHGRGAEDLDTLTAGGVDEVLRASVVGGDRERLRRPEAHYGAAGAVGTQPSVLHPPPYGRRLRRARGQTASTVRPHHLPPRYTTCHSARAIS